MKFKLNLKKKQTAKDNDIEAYCIICHDTHLLGNHDAEKMKSWQDLMHRILNNNGRET